MAAGVRSVVLSLLCTILPPPLPRVPLLCFGVLLDGRKDERTEMDCLVGWPPGTMPRLRLLLHLVGVFIIMFFFFFFSQLLVASHTPIHTHLAGLGICFDKGR